MFNCFKNKVQVSNLHLLQYRINIKKHKHIALKTLNSTCLLPLGILLLSIGLKITSGLTDAELLPDHKDYVIDSLFVALLSNGDAALDYNLVMNKTQTNSKLTLFGGIVQNLTLTDYNGNEIKYNLTNVQNTIEFYSGLSSNIHVTYITPDIVNKQNRNWTFALSFPGKFLLKLPSDAHIVYMNPPPFLTPTGEQSLWGFGPGNIHIKYIVGPLGTLEESKASIHSVSEAIKNAKLKYEGINITSPSKLLKQAQNSSNEQKYYDAVKYAAEADKSIQNITDNYVLAKSALSIAEKDLNNKKLQGYDTSRSDKFMKEAREYFISGDYLAAEKASKLAISQITDKPEFNPAMSVYLFPLILFSIAIPVVFVLKKRTKRNKVLQSERMIPTDDSKSLNQEGNIATSSNGNVDSTAIDNKIGASTGYSSPITSSHISEISSDREAVKDYVNKVVDEVHKIRSLPRNNDYWQSPVNLIGQDVADEKEELTKIVTQFKNARPYLRVEDKELLDFLVEKKGSTFESEIRKRFLLPRTSLWRLIKRLEREGIVEVSKIGGQNLIKINKI